VTESAGGVPLAHTIVDEVPESLVSGRGLKEVPDGTTSSEVIELRREEGRDLPPAAPPGQLTGVVIAKATVVLSQLPVIATGPCAVVDVRSGLIADCLWIAVPPVSPEVKVDGPLPVSVVEAEVCPEHTLGDTSERKVGMLPQDACPGAVTVADVGVGWNDGVEGGRLVGTLIEGWQSYLIGGQWQACAAEIPKCADSSDTCSNVLMRPLPCDSGGSVGNVVLQRLSVNHGRGKHLILNFEDGIDKVAAAPHRWCNWHCGHEGAE
jgi:hypothetical protein